MRMVSNVRQALPKDAQIKFVWIPTLLAENTTLLSQEQGVLHSPAALRFLSTEFECGDGAKRGSLSWTLACSGSGGADLLFLWQLAEGSSVFETPPSRTEPESF